MPSLLSEGWEVQGVASTKRCLCGVSERKMAGLRPITSLTTHSAVRGIPMQMHTSDSKLSFHPHHDAAVLDMPLLLKFLSSSLNLEIENTEF